MEYCFLDEEGIKIKKVPNCPDCLATFTEDKGANCLDSCSAKQLENKHLKVFEDIIKFCLPNRKMKFEYRLKTPIIRNKKFEWGWTLDLTEVICIFWYTLRSKKCFLRCCVHEASHIIDFENQFSVEERKILKTYLPLEKKYSLALKKKDKEELDRLWPEVNFYRKEYWELIKRWNDWDKMSENERHKREEWYKEYSELYQKLINYNSPWREYAYNNFDPLPHEYFIRNEDEKHRPWVGSLE